MAINRELLNYLLSALVLILAVAAWGPFGSEDPDQASLPDAEGGSEQRIRELEAQVARLEGELERTHRTSSQEREAVRPTGSVAEGDEEFATLDASSSNPRGWDPTLSQKWLRGDPTEPPRLDPGSIDPEAPMFFNPYGVEHLKQEETIAELHEIYELDRSEAERLVALDVLRMSWLGESEMDKEKAFPEEFAADALDFMSNMEDSDRRWKVLASLSGLEYDVVRDEARSYLETDQDPDVRKRAAVALAPFRDDPAIQKLLRDASRWDFSHEVRRYAKAALEGDWRFSGR